MNNNIKNVFNVLLSRTFNKSNFNKFLIIFIVGFISRGLIGYFYSINVYFDFFNIVSVSYYVCMYVCFYNLSPWVCWLFWF